MSLDVLSDQRADCRRFRVLTIVDGETLFASGSSTMVERRFCPGQIEGLSISGARVARCLDDLGARPGLPEEIVLDTGPEGASRAMFEWSERTGVGLRLERVPI